MTVAVAVAALATAGCGSGGGSSSGGKPDLVVSAAASLKDAFTQYAQQFPDATVRSSFAGSDELAAQIQQGVKPDVFASANTKLPDQLFQKGLVEKPVVFAGNRLAIAVRGSGGEVAPPSGLWKPGGTRAVGSAPLPAGGRARQGPAGLPTGLAG